MFWVFALPLVLHAAHSGLAQSKRQTSQRLKAEYVLNFLQYTEWPDSAFDDPSSPIVLGILGETPLAVLLDETMPSESVAGRPVVVVRSHTLDDLSRCQALLIGASGRRHFQASRGRPATSPVLTISDWGGVAGGGVCISFYMEKSRLRFAVDMRALNRAGIKVSSKLLRLAKVTHRQE